MGGAFKFFFANQWLFGGLLKSILCKIPASAALIRTTFAPTQLSGSMRRMCSRAARCLISVSHRARRIRTSCACKESRAGYAAGCDLLLPPVARFRVDTEEYRSVARAVAVPSRACRCAVSGGGGNGFAALLQYLRSCFPLCSLPVLKGRPRDRSCGNERLSIESLGRGIAFINTWCAQPAGQGNREGGSMEEEKERNAGRTGTQTDRSAAHRSGGA